MTTQVESINNLGQVIGTGLNAAAIFQSFIGTAAGSIAIPLLRGLPSAGASGINDLDQVVGDSSNGSQLGAWIWDTVNGTRDLNTLVPAGWSILTPNAINNRGQILAAGYNPSTGYSGTVVLTPNNLPPATPMPPSALLALGGLAGVAFYQLRRGRRSL